MKEKMLPVKIAVPEEASSMSPKQIILLMRSLGVGKENYVPPFHARGWATSEFLSACTRDEVIRGAKKFPPERTTVDSWFSPNGSLPDDRRDAWHYFFQVFFSYERREFGTLEWKAAYFEAIKREKVAAVARKIPGADISIAVEPPKTQAALIDILPILRSRK